MRNMDDAVVRALASHQCFPGFDSDPVPYKCTCMWVEFVVGSRLALRVFLDFSLGSPDFLPPQKLTSSNSNSIRIEDPHENQLQVRLM